VDRHFSLDIEDKQSPQPLNHVESLWVFVHNLQRERRQNVAVAQQSSQQSSQHSEAAMMINNKETTKGKRNSAKSLVNYLKNNKYHPGDFTRSHTNDDSNVPAAAAPKEEVEPFSRAIVQAIRLASELGDYKLIIALIEASVQFSNQHPIIMPRVFGEAIDGISRTSANIAKIKQLWNLGTSEQSVHFLTEPMGTYELNIMIKAIASRGKIKSALNLYDEYTQPQVLSDSENRDRTEAPLIDPDPYTLSSMFAALQESISDNSQIKIQNNTQWGVAQSFQCWQWNSAMNMLSSYMNRKVYRTKPLNNHVFASLLKLNERVSEVYPPSAHNGPRMALYLLNTMYQMNIPPDVVTCTLIISNLGYQWKPAVNLLYAMKTTRHENTDAGVWKLPRPNAYTYSAAITICAHCHQYQTAMELLHEMKEDDSLDSPNTWVYNAALLATTRSDSLPVVDTDSPSFLLQKLQRQRLGEKKAPKQRQSRERFTMAVKLLREMQQNDNFSCRPDTVTYNTVLATLDGIDSPPELDGDTFSGETTVHSLLDEMENHNILRDSITYRNALLAVRVSSDTRACVWRILDRAMLDKKAFGTVTLGLDQNRFKSKHHQQIEPPGRQPGGRAADGVVFVFDAAMTVLASHGDVEGVLLTFQKMIDQVKLKKIRLSIEKITAAQIHVIHALGRTSATDSELIPVFLKALGGDKAARSAIEKEFSMIDEIIFSMTADNEPLYSAAISSCLVANDIDNARNVLAMMKDEDLKPSEQSLQEIARTYARLAIIALETIPSESMNAANVDARSVECITQTTLAKVRAKNAFNIATKALLVPPAGMLSTIARTCASLGMWKEASTVMRMLHRRIQGASNDLSNIGLAVAAQTVLPGVHRALLRAASIQGNVTAALWCVEDIQQLSRHMEEAASSQNEEDNRTTAHPDAEPPHPKHQVSFLSADISIEPFRMQGEDWKLLMIAASKCGHWRVCLNTLQFLRPFLEATHPSSLGSTVEERSRRYGHLAPALTVAVKCLEIRSQYGWAVRAIDDWIEWSGRRPPKAAVLAAIRVLSARGRGSEVLSLLARCTIDGGAALVSYPIADENYEMVLYVGAITALHNEGLYDEADDAFIAAVTGHFLPFDLSSKKLDDGKQYLILDLHGMNVPVAHSAVRVALQQEVETASWSTKEHLKRTSPSQANDTSFLWDDDMVIVTGRGRNSALRMRPVLRPEVQRMLLEEFYPPLSTTSIPGNMGAVRIPSTDISAWLSHQRLQKGSRMLAVASVLRGASMDRIRQSIALTLQAGKEPPCTNGDSQKSE